jgi:alkylhydroperoxidase family enzyme
MLACVWHRRPAADRLERLREEAAHVVDAILGGPGATSPHARQRAFEGRADDAVVGSYVEAVRRHAHRMTTDDVERLRRSGLDDDAIFELTVAAAVGAANERLRAGLALVGRRP